MNWGQYKMYSISLLDYFHISCVIWICSCWSCIICLKLFSLGKLFLPKWSQKMHHCKSIPICFWYGQWIYNFSFIFHWKHTKKSAPYQRNTQLIPRFLVEIPLIIIQMSGESCRSLYWVFKAVAHGSTICCTGAWHNLRL